jgi:hypothetical protein
MSSWMDKLKKAQVELAAALGHEAIPLESAANQLSLLQRPGGWAGDGCGRVRRPMGAHPPETKGVHRIRRSRENFDRRF